MPTTASRLFIATSLFILSSAMLVGCNGSDWWDQPIMDAIAIQGDQVWFEYAPATDGMATLPSSLWSVNMTTGELQQVQQPISQWGLQVEGDFYVTEEVDENDTRGHIVAVRMSTREKTTIYERLHDYPNAWDPAHFAADGQVAVITPEGLLIYDLEAGQVARTIEVPEFASWVLGFDAGKALLGVGCYLSDACDYAQAMVSLTLVDAVTGERQDIPVPPGHENNAPDFFSASFTDGQIAAEVAAFRETAEMGTEILVFDVAASQWQVVLESWGWFNFGFPTGPLISEMGVNDEYVLLFTWELGWLRDNKRIGLANIASGETQTIWERNGRSILTANPSFPILQANKVIWGDPFEKTLTVYDIETGQQKTVSLAGVSVQEN